MLSKKIARLIERFSRQILISEIGTKGQIKLMRSRVAIVGCGATGSFEAELLARLGVGYIRIIDKDIIELSNLHRTLIFTEDDVESLKPKAIACADYLNRVNSDIKIDPIIDRLTLTNAEKLLRDVDLILDGTDNIVTRFIINEIAVKYSIPWIYVGVERWYGIVINIIPGKTPCLKCIIPQIPQRTVDACKTLGIINTVVSLATSIAVSNAIKILLGYEVESALHIIDGFRNEIDKIKISKNTKCPICVLNNYEYIGKQQERINLICESNQIEINPDEELKVKLHELKSLNELKIMKKSPYVAKILFNKQEIILFENARAIFLKNIGAEKALKIYNELLSLLEKYGLLMKLK